MESIKIIFVWSTVSRLGRWLRRPSISRTPLTIRVGHLPISCSRLPPRNFLTSRSPPSGCTLYPPLLGISMPPSRLSGSPSLPRRSHTLGGCRTCRRRHVKCDQKRPACENCHTLGLACEGFSDEVRWVRSSGSARSEVGRHGTRRHLYTGNFLWHLRLD